MSVNYNILKFPPYISLRNGWEDYKNFVDSCGYGYEGCASSGQQFLISALIFYSDAKLIYEIGFNAGHMTFIMCKSMEIAGGKVVAFDNLISHRPGADKMKELFPDTFEECVWGDSRNTLPSRFSLTGERPDIIHIDGGHSYEVVSSDLNHSLKNIKPGGFILMDDAQLTSPVYQAACEQLGKDNFIHCINKEFTGDNIIYQKPL